MKKKKVTMSIYSTPNPAEDRLNLLMYLAINDELRKKIINQLSQGDNVTISSISKLQKITRTRAKQEMSILMQTGVVKSQHLKSRIYYYIDDDVLSSALNLKINVNMKD